MPEITTSTGSAVFYRKMGTGPAMVLLHGFPESGLLWRYVWDALSESFTLIIPDFGKPFHIMFDASIEGTGAVLLQEGHPVAYCSAKNAPAERNYSTTEQELLGVIKALKNFRCYVEGAVKPVEILTDHHPNTYLQTQANLSRRQARWSEFMQRFDYVWKHVPGSKNMADAISRNPDWTAYESVKSF